MKPYFVYFINLVNINLCIICFCPYVHLMGEDLQCNFGPFVAAGPWALFFSALVPLHATIEARAVHKGTLANPRPIFYTLNHSTTTVVR